MRATSFYYILRIAYYWCESVVEQETPLCGILAPSAGFDPGRGVSSMAENSFHIAQLNIARMRAPIDAPLMADFVARLDEVNALADTSPGFVWRLQTGEGNATSLRPYDDDLILV